MVLCGFDLGEGGPASPDLGDDLLGLLVPHEGLRIIVPVLGPRLDGLDQVRGRGEDALSKSSFGQFVERAFDEVQPRRRGGREVQVPTCPLGVSQPFGHRRCLVGREVVEHHVKIEVLGDVEVDGLGEGEDVGRLVGLLGVIERLAGPDVHGGEEIGGAVTFVVMGQRHPPASLHGQGGLGAVERLDLGLLVEAEHHGLLGRVQVEPDYVHQLLLEVGVVGDLEGVDLPGLQVVVPPDAGDGVLADAEPLGHQSRRPVGRTVIRDGMKRVVHHRLHGSLREPRPSTPARGDAADTVDALGLEPTSPGPHRLVGGVATPGHLVVPHAIGGQQQGLGLDHLAVPERRGAGDHREGGSLFVGHGQRRCGHQYHGATLAIQAISTTDH